MAVSSRRRSPSPGQAAKSPPVPSESTPKGTPSSLPPPKRLTDAVHAQRLAEAHDQERTVPRFSLRMVVGSRLRRVLRPSVSLPSSSFVVAEADDAMWGSDGDESQHRGLDGRPSLAEPSRSLPRPSERPLPAPFPSFRPPMLTRPCCAGCSKSSSSRPEVSSLSPSKEPTKSSK